mgnify:CR=1 FL=1
MRSPSSSNSGIRTEPYEGRTSGKPSLVGNDRPPDEAGHEPEKQRSDHS